MKILNVIGSNKKGGAEQFFIRHALAMNERGIDQVIVVRKDGWVEEKLRGSGISPVAFPFGGVLDLRTRRKVDKLIQTEQPDVILSWMGRAAKHIPDTTVPHITRLGNYYPLKHYTHCDFFVGNTPQIAAFIRDNGIAENRVSYIPNFVETKPAEPADRGLFDTPRGEPLMLWLGRMTHSKGPDVLIRALANVPRAHLWMAGHGEMHDELVALVETLGLRDRVHFLGWREDVFNLLSAADISVCASRHEALGNVILEAWAQSTPVVAARSPGPEHLIQDGRTGILVENDCPESMAAGLNRLIEDPEQAAAIGATGHRCLAENYGREAIIDQYVALFEKAKHGRA
jgi:glycosyltransferase involved in cell wall biosynthesis